MSEKKRGLEKYICLIGYLIVPCFFVVLYCIMLMSYEELNQKFPEMTKTIPEILYGILNYIPRAGEFYQHTAVHYMTLSMSFGLDLLFRLLTATMASGLIYFSTFLVLKRKPKLKYKDLLIFLGLFLLLMISEASEVFTYRFSYVHNYILAALLTVVFLLPFRLQIENKKFLPLCGMVILGFLFGISTEIAPLAFLIILAFIVVVKFIKKQLHWSDFWQKYRLYLFGVIGVLLGIAFFYLIGAGISFRTNGGYAEVYDYVSIFNIFKSGKIVTLYKLWQHAWFNMRYLAFPVLMMGLFILIETLIKKFFAKDKKTNIYLYCVVLAFCALYMAASMQIKVLDDMYPRYMFLVYLSIFISVMSFVRYLLDIFNIEEKILKRSAIIACIVAAVAFIDMTFAFVFYRVQVNPYLDKIARDEITGSVITTGEIQTKKVNMAPSPIFKIMQLTPFDWGDLGAGAMKFGTGPQVK